MELIKGKRFVVTGGAGFIGSNIVTDLVKNNNEVTVIDNLLTGKLENLSDVMDEIRFVEGDIQDLNLLKREFDDIDYVLHQAALPSVPRSVDDPIASNQNNIDGTLNVLIAARDAGVKRVVYASSSSAYGNSPTLPKKEDMKPEPLSPYAVTKLVGEYYCKVFYDLYGLETVSLRYFNVFGPHQDPNSQYAAVIPKFITTMLKGNKPVIFGDGTQSRDFTYVQNNVEANLLACVANRAAGKLFNIACGERITLNDLVDILNHILGTDIESVYTEARQGDVKHSLADINLAKDILGYEPKCSFVEGLKKTVENLI
jgi:UDP-glucose 4-epimerase